MATVLLLTIFASNSVHTSVAEYVSREACEKAGQAHVAAFAAQGYNRELIVFSCSAKR